MGAFALISSESLRLFCGLTLNCGLLVLCKSCLSELRPSDRRMESRHLISEKESHLACF